MAKFVASFLRSVPLPRGPQRTLILYRWLLVAVGIYTVLVTWNVWQVRSSPDWHPWKFATPDSHMIWNHRPSDAQLAPMLPAWDWLPQFDVGALLIAGFVLVLFLPRTGLTALAAIWIIAVLMDRTRLQPHYQIGLLILATFPSAGAQACRPRELDRALVLGRLSQGDHRFHQARRFARLQKRHHSIGLGPHVSAGTLRLEHAQFRRRGGLDRRRHGNVAGHHVPVSAAALAGRHRRVRAAWRHSAVELPDARLQPDRMERRAHARRFGAHHSRGASGPEPR